MWGAFIITLAAAAGVLFVAGPIAALVVAACGSALLLAVCWIIEQQRLAVQVASGLEVAIATQRDEIDFPPLQQKAS